MKITFIFLFTIVFSFCNCHAEWKNSGSQSGGNARSIYIDGSKVIVSTPTGDIYTTINKGNIWTSVTFDDTYINSIITFGKKIYAASYKKGILCSDDDGQTWKQFAFPDTNVRTLAVNGKKLYAGTDEGLYVTSDTGKKWSLLGFKYQNITSISTRNYGKCIVVGIYSDGAFISTNYGKNWSQIGLADSLINTVSYFNQHIVAGTSVYGIWFAEDSTQWLKQTKLEHMEVFSICFSDSIIFAGTDRGVYKSADHGENWIFCGFQKSFITCMSFNDGILYIGTKGEGVFYSLDYGKNWIQFGISTTQTYSIGSLQNNVFIGTQRGIYLSTDDGSIWSPVGWKSYPIYNFSNSENKISAGSAKGVFVSYDFGNSWEYIGPPGERIFSSVILDNIIYVSTAQGIYYCPDDKAKYIYWNKANYDGDFIYSLTENNGNLFAGLRNGGLFMSSDKGESWADIGLKGFNNWSLAFKGDTIYSGSWGNGLVYSHDNGKVWLYTTLTDTTISSLLIYGDYIFAATPGSGIFLSSDKGNSWKNIGLEYLYINGLTIKDSVLYVSTAYNGVWFMPVPELITSVTENNQSESINVYPNPASDFLIVDINIPENNDIDIKIINLIGCVVYHEGLKGNQRVIQKRINVENFAKGYYTLQLITPGRVINKKVIIE